MVTGNFHQYTHAVVFYIYLTLGTSTAESGSSERPGLHGADVTLDDSDDTPQASSPDIDSSQISYSDHPGSPLYPKFSNPPLAFWLLVVCLFHINDTFGQPFSVGCLAFFRLVIFQTNINNY